MTSYDSFMCPDCERYFRVIWTDPIPATTTLAAR